MGAATRMRCVNGERVQGEDATAVHPVCDGGELSGVGLRQVEGDTRARPEDRTSREARLIWTNFRDRSNEVGIVDTGLAFSTQAGPALDVRVVGLIGNDGNAYIADPLIGNTTLALAVGVQETRALRGVGRAEKLAAEAAVMAARTEEEVVGLRKVGGAQGEGAER